MTHWNLFNERQNLGHRNRYFILVIDNLLLRVFLEVSPGPCLNRKLCVTTKETATEGKTIRLSGQKDDLTFSDRVHRAIGGFEDRMSSPWPLTNLVLEVVQ